MKLFCQIATRAFPLFAILFFCSCQISKERVPVPKSATSSIEKLEFLVQPFEGLTIKSKSQTLEYSILEKDKSIARIKVFGSPQNSELEFSIPGFEPYTQNLDSISSEEKEILINLLPSRFSHKFFRAFPTGVQPKSVRFLDEERIGIPLLEGPGVEVIHIQTGFRKIASPPQEFAKEKGFVELEVLPEAKEIYVTQMHTHKIHVFDLQTLEYKTTISLSGKFPKILLYLPKKNLLLCSNWISEDISIIDPYTKKEIKRTAKLGQPRGLAYLDEFGKLYIAQFSSSFKTDGGGRLLAYSLEKEEILKTLGEEGNKRHLVIDHIRKILYLSDLGNSRIEIFDIRTDTLLQKLSTFDKPNTIDLSKDRKFLYISTRGPNHPTLGYMKKGLEFGKIQVVNAESFTIQEEWEAGNQPTGLNVSPSGKWIATTDFLDDRIRIYERK